jgi:DNA-binding NtrC family response regulator
MKTQNNISVFLVDDNAVFLKTLADSLNERFKSEIQIETFSTGEACLKIIQQNPDTASDIVVLDYHLNTDSKNAMNGIDVLKKIKEINPKIIVIMLSAEDKIKIATDSITYGAYEYVVKSETAFIRTQNILKNSIEKELNSKILKITMSIMEKYPELYKYIDEIPETIIDEQDPGIMLQNLKAYYDSLDSMLNKYILEHPESVK